MTAPENSQINSDDASADRPVPANPAHAPGMPVVTVIGDGALTGGLAYEGLNNAGSSGEPVGATEAASGTGLVAANNTIFMGGKDDYDLAQIRVL